VIVEVVLTLGITPVAIVMFGVTVPEYNNVPAPLVSVPTPKCVIAPPGLAVHSPKSTFAAGLTLFAVTVQPAPLRATATRAYPVYAVSLVVWLPVSPGSAVCRDTYKLPAVVLPRNPVASPMFAAFVLLNKSNSNEFSQEFALDMPANLTHKHFSGKS
jgi:hypothetical protein